MRLSAANGDFVELRIAGYQFPELVDAPYDSNWLIISGVASIDGREWSFTDPSMLTYEVAALARWLQRIAAGEEAVEEEVGFLEPNLSFRKIEGSLRTFFALECAPPWAKNGDGWHAHFVETPCAPGPMVAAAQGLLLDLQRFPQRADR